MCSALIRSPDMTHPSIHARSHPDKLAVVMAGSGASLSYAELVARANQGHAPDSRLASGPATTPRC